MTIVDVYIEIVVAIIGVIIFLIIMPIYLRKSKGYAKGLIYGGISFAILEFIMMLIARSFLYDGAELAGLISQMLMISGIIITVIGFFISIFTKSKK